MRSSLIALLLAALPAVSTAATPAPTAVQLTVDPAHPGARIDRNLFGQFAEHLGAGIYGGVWVGPDSPIPNVRGIRSDVVAALRALKVPNVRWPGGCFADEYHWRDGIGPASQRRVGVNANWGAAIETNAFGSHEFFDFIGQIGSEAYLSVNVGTGTPREAAEWLEYLTGDARTTAGSERARNGHPEPYRVKFIGLGNEAWGCGGSMSPDYYVNQMRMYARYVRSFNPAQAGPQAPVRVAVGPNGDETGYTEAVMKAWRERVWAWDIEALSLHFYTSAGWPPAHPSEHFGAAEYALLLKDTFKMEGLVARHSAIMDQHDPQKKVALAVDEWGVWLAPQAGTNPGFLVQQNSLRDALLASLNLNIFARHADRVRMANIAQMANVLQAMIVTDGPVMQLTPTYHVFRLYVPFQDAQYLPLSMAAGDVTVAGITLPRADALAGLDREGRTWVAVTNLDPAEPLSLDLRLAGRRLRTATGEVLTAATVDAVNTLAKPDGVAPRPLHGEAHGDAVRVELPPRSVSVLRLE